MTIEQQIPARAQNTTASASTRICGLPHGWLTVGGPAGAP